ncbi:hypothetical protein INQ41_04090 [Lysobacter ciconiae]|uniref:Uncharacterized protein n=1 Tax=Novilysobacter ciconiae TaxID=2781022 RepID=A0A7S6UHB8_9GAMM|nr:hypothetical protein [Lysobacter ciconiae]QOW20220.1 hypothetical protein INQ41_04090 [Lysobacter ciconiae]
MVDFAVQDPFCVESVEGFGPGSAPRDYDHDRVTNDDLLLLGIGAGESASDHRWVSDSGFPNLVTELDAPPTATGRLSRESHEPAAEEPSAVPEPIAHPTLDFFVDVPNTELELPLDEDVDEFAGGWSTREESEVPWHLEVPEPDDVHSSGGAVEFPGGVLGSERAIQLAMAFLQTEDLVSVRNLDLLTDIILERGWSGVQTQVRALVRAGYSVEQIHLMFQITVVWLHCVQSDILAPDGWHGGHRLTWLQAARLLDVMGYDATIEEIADFLSAEQDVWSQLRRRSGELATFRDYLFRYRLSTHTEVDDGIWQSNLDPTDERSFDGTRHCLYSSDWWDEPTGNIEPELPALLRSGYDLSHITEKLGLDFGVQI